MRMERQTWNVSTLAVATTCSRASKAMECSPIRQRRCPDVATATRTTLVAGPGARCCQNTHADSPRVQLQRGHRPHVVHAVLDALGQRARLAGPGDDHHHLACIHDGADADSERHLGHGADVVVEEAAVGNDGVVRQRLDARA